MITVTSAQLTAWIVAFIWPFTRIAGLITAAPLFGSLSAPFQVKIGLGIMLSLIIAPTIPVMPAIDPMSLAGVLVLAQQLVIGLAMGFSMSIVFTAVEMAGEISGLTMGFGFASFFDPQTSARSSAISQFLALLAILIFLSANVHLTLLSVLAESFTTLPISSNAMESKNFLEIVHFGGRIFSAGLQLSLPIVAALLITNAALGILTKAAPQLNLFGIGFPITIGVGFVMIGLVLPYLATPLENLFREALDLIRQITIHASVATR